MNNEHIDLPAHIGARATFRSYAIGFVCSILLTFVPYVLVVNHMLNGQVLTVSIVSLAIMQLVVQAMFFLHLSTKSKARWNMVVFIFAVLIVFIVVAGSLWIMANLNYNMTSAELNAYMSNQN